MKQHFWEVGSWPIICQQEYQLSYMKTERYQIVIPINGSNLIVWPVFKLIVKRSTSSKSWRENRRVLQNIVAKYCDSTVVDKLVYIHDSFRSSFLFQFKIFSIFGNHLFKDRVKYLLDYFLETHQYKCYYKWHPEVCDLWPYIVFRCISFLF